MLYPESHRLHWDEDTFRHPPAVYRGAPFWAWNARLEAEELTRQMDCLRQMGFGGVHMHPRTGLDTPYLSDEFMDMVKACVEKARNEGMYAALYDEDRWPSGAAGGLVTRDEAYRSRYLLFTSVPYGSGSGIEANITSSARAARTENGSLLGVYDVVLDEDGCLASARRIEASAAAEGKKWYAYLETPLPSPWYNNQTYVNTLDKKAIDRFIEITYSRYLEVVGDDFGTVVPSIFTDEPQFSHKTTLTNPTDDGNVTLPFTHDLPETFRAAYGEELLDKLPELFWELPNGEISTVRYHYHDHVTQRFTEAFADNCGRWCREHGLMLTGHMMEEPTLQSQTAALGEAMRAYRAFELPGIDMLCNNYEYTTAKQAQSAAHQFGREGVLSELYGVTSWNFDFRMHKLQGDWQAALGVTRRVPHLSMVSMKGEAKRDYPSSINYQAPWYKEYPLVEDHFARVGVAMTRGKPLVRIGVIHPVESYWLHWGPAVQTRLIRDQLEENFQRVTDWLLFGGLDFDFISESLLPEQCSDGGYPLQVGKMQYDAIVVPGCETLRSTTVERLQRFQEDGGKLLFLGKKPLLMDARPDETPGHLYDKAVCLPMERYALLAALEPVRMVELRDFGGAPASHYLHQLRQDGESRLLFVAQGRPQPQRDMPAAEGIHITVEGTWDVTLLDTLTGESRRVDAVCHKGRTTISKVFQTHDSLLLRFDPPGTARAESADNVQAAVVWQPPAAIPARVAVTLDEPNVLLLDKAAFALDDGTFAPCMELLRADNLLRQQLGYPPRFGESAQPWVLPTETPAHTVHLRFEVESLVEVESVSLALEDAGDAVIYWNGEQASPVQGYYVDRCIGVRPLGRVQKGKNLLEIALPFGRRTNLEWCYLLGDFGVEVAGSAACITEPVRTLAFGDVSHQGLPFYGGNITYHLPLPEQAEQVSVHIPHYRGAMVALSQGGKRLGNTTFAPYTCEVHCRGDMPLDVTLFGSRINTFGSVHMVTDGIRFLHPGTWRTGGDSWSDEYVLEPVGILSSPVLQTAELK